MRAFTAGMIVAVTAFNLPAAPASATNVTLQSIMDASGQPVYDLQNSLIGTIKETRTINGVHSVVVATEPKFAGGSYDIAIAQSTMEPRSTGGWLVWLSDSAIPWIPPYKPDAP